ncbi:MAG: hypothetical protein IPP61_08855 [Cytophagaceae bacterium]|nr:hypothetical protein [Cytophagaceae bacterium]MBL0302447.1 hypothetical protein [Cytophagaceae bacterium]MBL0325274.1 hypothetical protein [Cytophagaceae bacterium]
MKNNKIFKIVFFLFLLGVIAVLIDMARQTTAPWNKRKQLERAIPK